MLMSCNCQCLIDVATRVTSGSKALIDHEYTSDIKSTNTAEVLVSDVSDHHGIYVIISENKTVNNKHKND